MAATVVDSVLIYFQSKLFRNIWFFPLQFSEMTEPNLKNPLKFLLYTFFFTFLQVRQKSQGEEFKPLTLSLL